VELYANLEQKLDELLEPGFSTSLRMWVIPAWRDLGKIMRNTYLEDRESSQVDWLGLVILGEGSYSSSVMSGSLSGEESQGSVSRTLEFSVRHSPLIKI
jgi:hypothetical protein